MDKHQKKKQEKQEGKNDSNKKKSSIKNTSSDITKISGAVTNIKTPMSRLRLILVLLLVFVIGIAITVTFYYSNKILVYSETNMRLNVTANTTSFNTGTNMLDFARNHPGGGGSKMITVRTARDALVNIKATGSISQFITFSDNNFLLAKDASKEIKIFLSIPDNASLGYYDGTLKVYFYRP